MYADRIVHFPSSRGREVTPTPIQGMEKGISDFKERSQHFFVFNSPPQWWLLKLVDSFCWHERSAFQSAVVQAVDLQDDSGPLFFSFPIFSVTTFSHRRSAQMKIPF